MTQPLRTPGIPSVVGYADRESVHACDEIAFYVSSSTFPRYQATIVRLISPEAGPDGPPFEERELASSVDGQHESVEQALFPGSFVFIPGPLHLSASATFAARVKPTLPREGSQTLISLGTAGGICLELRLAAGRPELAVTDGDTVRSSVVTSMPLPVRQWSAVHGVLNIDAGELTIGFVPAERWSWVTPTATVARITLSETDRAWLQGRGLSGPVTIGGRASSAPGRAQPVATTPFNGCIERPRIWDQALTEQEITAWSADPSSLSSLPIADWDFSQEISSELIRDVSGNAADGYTVNLPARAIRGSNWSGRTLEWMSRPEEYGAIHFHDDDIDDARWEESLRLRVPAEWGSGCYALRLRTDGREDGDEYHVPFFVRPLAGTTTAPIAYLIPTATYAAYANMRLRVAGQAVEHLHGRLTVLDGTDLLLLTMPQIGGSTYDTHSDGSLVMYSSMRRPVTNFRPKGRTYKFCQDLLTVAWLEHDGFGFDVLTDEDLDREGLAALSGYQVVLTGSHPEYYSAGMLATVDEYLGQGGRFMYLGGNGFYTAAEFHPVRRGTVEVRRPGLETLWPIDHTEGTFSFTGAPAGVLAKIGLPAGALVGVDFFTQGFDACSYYRRAAASRDPRAEFAFAGVKDEVIGDFGLLRGGAAGYEIDRNDPSTSPPHSLVLASSEAHSNIYDIMVPSIAQILPTGETDSPEPIRADMVFFETSNGGAVFSVGSIAWSGSLSHNGYDNNVALISRNVLTRFCDPRPFPMPEPSSAAGGAARRSMTSYQIT